MCWYLVLCYNWCEIWRRVIVSFVCNLIYMDVLIVRLRSSGFGCYLFGVYFGCLMFADAILSLAHTLLAMRHMLKICDLYARMPLTM